MRRRFAELPFGRASARGGGLAFSVCLVVALAVLCLRFCVFVFLDRAVGGLAQHGGDTRPRQVLRRHATPARVACACLNLWRRCSRQVASRAPFGLGLATWRREHSLFPLQRSSWAGGAAVMLFYLVRWPAASQGHAHVSERGLGLCGLVVRLIFHSGQLVLPGMLA